MCAPPTSGAAISTPRVAAQRLGERRIADLYAAYRRRRLCARRPAALLDYGERLTRAATRRAPARHVDSSRTPSTTTATPPEPVPIQASKLTIDARTLVHFDFSGSATHSARASINAVAPVTRSACYYVIRCLLPPGTPMNSGLFRPITFYAARALGGGRPAARCGRRGQRGDLAADRRHRLGRVQSAHA